MKKICIVTTSRADYGLLRPVIRKVEASKHFKLNLVVTGSHIKSTHQSISEIKEDKFPITEIIEIFNNDDSKLSNALSVATATEKFSKFFNESKPDLLLILGDRFELMGIVTPAYLLGIPIAHMCGGDLTFGAIDESIRHAITKLSTFHFVTNKESYDRVKQLGESPSAVFNTGHTALDNLKEFNLLSSKELESTLGINFNKKNILFTFHPVTFEEDLGTQDLRNSLDVLSSLKETNIFITRPNVDSGNQDFNCLLDDFVSSQKNTWIFDSLGTHKYFSLLNEVDVVMGNSSSALMEAPYFQVPSINIGDRQEGRPQGNSIINCNTDNTSIEQALDMAFNFDPSNITCPYGNGDASTKIAQDLETIFKQKLPLKKKFMELKHAC